MITAHSYDASLAKRLVPLLQSSNWNELLALLDSLSNAQFRTAGIMLGGRLTDDFPDESYWPFFSALVTHNARAFLGTLLKQVIRRLENRSLSLDNEYAVDALRILSSNEINVQKTLAALLPLMSNPEEAERLFQNLKVTDYTKRIAPLLKTSNTPCAFLLLRALKYVEHDRNLLIRTTHYIMSKGDAFSFNLASLLKTYFALEEIKGTFSLRLQPYELSRIEQSYQAFSEAMNQQ